MFPDVGFQNRIKMLELSVCYEPNNEHLPKTENLINRSSDSCLLSLKKRGRTWKEEEAQNSNMRDKAGE